MDRQGQGAYIPQELLKELSKASNRLLIGIPCERVEGECRLALTPEAVDMLTDRGHRVLVEAGAGLGINYSDNHYSEAGAEIVATPAEVYPVSYTHLSVGYFFTKALDEAVKFLTKSDVADEGRN